MNKKRVQRLWRNEGLKVPQRTRKRRRLGTSENGLPRRQASRPHEVWAVDFVMDMTEDGRRLKILSVIDEASRYCLSTCVERSMTARDVMAELERLMTIHGAPGFVRSDNGPEFVAEAVRSYLAASGVETLFIEPGSPWQNGYSESFNARFRDEFLNLEVFTSLVEAQVLTHRWREEYNEQRPHGALSYRTPREVLETRASRLAIGEPSP